MIKIQVFITSYNREKLLKQLLKDIDKNKNNYQLNITVIDDGSSQAYNLPSEINYFRFQENNGKENYYKVINKIFDLKRPAHYYIVLPDDVQLKDNFFDEAIRLWNSIGNMRKISLNLLQDNRGLINWTNYKRRGYGNELFQTQWNDLCFIANSSFFINIGRIKPILGRDFKKYGSGVGQQISQRLHKKGYMMYQVKNSLVIHGDHESVMNKELREKTKLIAK